MALFNCPELDARTHDFVAIVNDNREIGRQAASHLLKTKRCASYASRRLLDLRFRERYATSIGETIIAIRLAEARRLLKSTALPIDAIAAKCNYRSVSHLKTLFLRRYGMTMGEFRNSGKRA